MTAQVFKKEKYYKITMWQKIFIVLILKVVHKHKQTEIIAPTSSAARLMGTKA